MSDIHSAARETYTALAEGVSTALLQDNIPQAMHLAWLLMFQPACPLQLQAHAVLVHSAASLTLGGDPEVIENNLQTMIKRLKTALARLAVRGLGAPWNLEALKQLRAALELMRNSREVDALAIHTRSSDLRELDSIVMGFGKMDLDCASNGSAIMDEVAEPVDIWDDRQD